MEPDEIEKIETLKNGFRKYGKIHRLGKEETDGILVGDCHIQEKIDGANTQIWLDKDTGEICCGSRSQKIVGGFNGFYDYVQKHEGIKKFLGTFPHARLYGEWLVRHTISYKETAYRKWYLFDVYDNGKYWTSDVVREIATPFGMETVPYHGVFTNPTIEQIKEFVGKTEFGDRGEGVVIKNYGFVNKFGDTQYAKVVTESFKEDNAVVFGGNNKHSETYWEVYIVNKYMTLPRVQKNMNKILPTLDRRFDMKDIPRIMGTCYHDMITEECFEIAKLEKTIDFGALKRIANKKSKQIFIDLINDDVSIADRQN